MTASPVAILGAGMMTGVGLTAPASCAAIRSGSVRKSSKNCPSKMSHDPSSHAARSFGGSLRSSAMYSGCASISARLSVTSA